MIARGGITILDDEELVFRESQYASRNFKISNSGKYSRNALVPRPKFLFFARFNTSKTALVRNLPSGRDTPAYNNIKEGVIFQIKQIDKPKFNIQTETMHQYNKKRVVQTKLDYNPMTINFHDDIGDRVLEFWADYYQYYYGDGGRNAKTDWRYDIVDRDFYNGQQDGWGYKGKFVGGSSNMHFLESIDLLQFYGREYTSISFIRPIITVFDHDNSDYAEGREGTGIRISFDYEGVIYDLAGTPIDGHEDEFGFLQDYYDPTNSTPTFEDNNNRRNTNVDITSGLTLPINTNSLGRERLQDQVAERAFVSASAKAVPGDRSFGSSINTSLSSLVSAGGISPSPDIVEKATGVKNTINNFGVPLNQTVGNVLTTSSAPKNTGIDSLKVNNAASILNTAKTTNEQQVSQGQTKIATSGTSSEFSKSFGTGAALAVNEGAVGSVATYPSEITHNSTSENSVVNKLPDGTYQLTDSGSTTMNTLRSPNSAVGVRKLTSPWENQNLVDNNKRLLRAENGESNIF